MGGAPEGSGALGSGGRASGGAATGGAPSGGQGGTGGTGSGGADGSSCPYEGHLTYELNDPEGWPPGIADKIRAAVDEALSYYNCYADLTKSLTINYKPSVPTAEANVDGWISFGSNESYMVVATTMHEIGHTLGVGYYPWSELLEDGVWIGPHVSDFMESLPAEERDPDAYSQRTYIRADTQHFWPYGLNQASEHQSEYSLINHIRIVRLMQLDKQTFLDGEL